ncbi:(p)ppGpp synthetase [Clostridium boliviensis]|uniref:(P)ppGpp synthetase n=1 Tax=Clostridium boliviensis TaxID=318465 RepID=A0ABU4GLS6_9CLOT|nr:(p)ppGpp synthetase [Clostridium boliviensis]MDW2798561.1 (p)ppGpp synthetase [Clostridium boliviensis]
MTEEEYLSFIQPYEDALNNIQVRVDVLNKDYRRKKLNYPIHHVQYRLKQKESIENKLIKNGKAPTVDLARECLTDIAGIRVICYFIRDIYGIIGLLRRQTDIVVIKESDYIENPKPNGYRSYHIVFGVPVYHTDGMEYFPVEVQLRTMAMDLWASMEHRICYKGEKKAEVAAEFINYGAALKQMEEEMEGFLSD